MTAAIDLVLSSVNALSEFPWLANGISKDTEKY